MDQEKNVINSLNKIEEAIYKAPLSLLSIKDEKVIKSIDNFLPYSIGMEFECEMKPTYKSIYFENIPNILDVNVDKYEQRYRIPNGLKGLICLDNICNNLREYSILDIGSSNHYHFDMTDVSSITHSSNDFKNNNTNWIIEELITWKSTRSLSQAYLGSWYKYNDLGTLEIRVGEPSFDYEVIVKRLIQGSNIVRKLKSIANGNSLYKLNEDLKKLEQEDSEEVDSEEEINRIINLRKSN